MTFFTIFVLAHLLISIGALYSLIRNGSKPYRILGWMMTILAIPLLGALFYSWFGINWRKRKLFDRKKLVDEAVQQEFLFNYEHKIEPRRFDAMNGNPYHLKLAKLLTRTNKSPVTYNNKITILNDGKDTFDAIFKACKQARKSIHIQYYIYLDGELADQLLKIFEEKVKEGVKVRFLYDALGSWSLSKSYLMALSRIGVEAYSFMPVRFGALARTNFRNHRKILVVDRAIGFTGGINVDDKYINEDPVLGHWTDTHLRLEGMSVNFLQAVFLRDWYFVSGQNLISPEAVVRMEPIGNTPVQIVASGPDSEHSTILQEYVYVIGSALKYVYIANPYVVPNEIIIMALKSSALSGVDVRLIIPEKLDSAIIKWTIRSNFETLLAAGVKIYLYQDGFLHSKIMAADDAICSIGTANLDVRSFEQNFEVNALIYDEETTVQLREQLLGFQQHSIRVDPIEFMKRSRWSRARENLGRLVSPVM